LPKFNFRDSLGIEWRVRRGRYRWPSMRWRIEQWTDARWLLRAFAPTRNVAQERMTTLWARDNDKSPPSHSRRRVRE